MGGSNRTRLTRDALRRLLVSLISVEQAARIQSGAISPDVAIERKLMGIDTDGIDALAVEEDVVLVLVLIIIFLEITIVA